MKKLKTVRKYLLAAAILLFALSSCEKVPKYTTDSTEALEHLKTGNHHSYELNYTQALRSFQKAIQSDSTFAYAYLQAAEMWGTLGAGDSSMIYLEKAHHHSQNAARFERLYIQYHWAASHNNYELANATMDTLQKQYPNNIDVILSNAYRKWHQLRYDDAIAKFKQVIKLHPDYIVAYNNIGYLYAKKGMFKEGLQYLKKYRELAPHQLNPYDSIAEIYMMLGRYHEAISLLERITENRKDDLRANEYLGAAMQIGLATAYTALGQYQKALQTANHIAVFYDQKCPHPDVCKFRVLQVYRPLEDIANMEKDLQNMLPKSSETDRLAYLCILAIDRNDFSQALQHITTIRKRSKSTTQYSKKRDFLVLLAALEGELNLKSGLYAEAAEQFAQAAVTLSDTSLAFTYRYKQYYACGKAGNYNRAIAGLRKLLGINPNYAEALLAISEFYFESDRETEAKTYLAYFLNLWKEADPHSPMMQRARSLRKRLESS